MNIYIVGERGKTGGTVLTVFARKEDAEPFLASLVAKHSREYREFYITERTLWSGQPPTLGFNK